MDHSGWNMWVFRDGRKTVQGKWLLDGLATALHSLQSYQGQAAYGENLLTSLLWSGELECALADLSSSHASAAAEITDRLATALVRESPACTTRLLEILGQFRLPGKVSISVPESFAYYALHPLRFAEFISEMGSTGRTCVVGIRSIGTTLSALVLAALKMKGVQASRITVRPTGHPYDRELELTPEQQRWISEGRDADFLVVDEGPGLSGSSFLATAEALERSDVASERILLVGTRVAVPEDLRATDGAARWKRFRSKTVPNVPRLPLKACLPLGGGAWRDRFLSAQSHPGAWTQLEPLKYLSADGHLFYRFEGYGRYGAEVASRAKILAMSGYSPRHFGNVAGFGCYEFVNGNPLDRREMSPEITSRLAGYCAMRAREFACAEPSPDLENMLRFDWKTEFGVDLGDEAKVEVVNPVIADGRMLPHEWLRSDDGRLLKVDAVSHGDDHFFPGPCDIAWDLAGAIVEWQLRGAQREDFLHQYQQQSGDDPRPRLRAYLLAYSIFRCAFCKMAAKALGGTQEEPLLHRDYLHYREQCERIFAEADESVNAILGAESSKGSAVAS